MGKKIKNKTSRRPVTAVPSPVPFRRDFSRLHDGTVTGRFEELTAVEMTAVPVDGTAHSPIPCSLPSSDVS
jgi:hypothetical protein